jgi:tetratricopeptide (TPR) repeat protein
VVRHQRIAAKRRQTGDLDGAERHYRRALAFAARALPPDHLATGRVCNDLGVVLKYTGGFPEAIALYDRAYAVLP